MAGVLLFRPAFLHQYVWNYIDWNMNALCLVCNKRLFNDFIIVVGTLFPGSPFNGNPGHQHFKVETL